MNGTSSHSDLVRASGLNESTVRLYVQAFQEEKVTRLAGKEPPPGAMRAGARQLLYELNPHNKPNERATKMTEYERHKGWLQRRREREAKLLGLLQCEPSQ